MKVARDDLASALAVCAGVVDKRQTLPILRAALIAPGDGGATVTATDMRTSVVLRVPCASSDAPLAIDVERLVSICATAASETIALQPDRTPGWCVVTAGRARFRIPTHTAADFPDVEYVRGPDVDAFSIPADILTDLLDVALATATKDATSYNLHAVYIETATRGEVTAVGTDRGRLSALTRTVDGAWLTRPILLPRDAAALLRKHLAAADGTVAVRVGEGSAAFTLSDALRVRTQLVEAEFPAWREYVPKPPPIAIHVNAVALRDALARVALCASDPGRRVDVIVDPAVRDGITLTASDSARGEASEVVAATHNARRGVRAGFNAMFLTSGIAVAAADEVTLALSDAASAAFMAGTDPSRLFMLMPHRS